MATTIFSCQNIGIQGQLIAVEVDILQGLSAFSIVGLGDSAVHESKERVRSAIKSSGFDYPQQKKVINLAPAHLPKHGPHFDLPIAIGLLAASGQLNAEAFKRTIIAGELALDGSVRSINGVLTMALFAKEKNYEQLIVSIENMNEARLVQGLNIIGVSHIKELVSYANDGVAPRHIPLKPAAPIAANQLTFDDIHGNETAKRALEIAAAGGHHILLTGPPGIGKTVLAKAFSSILPPLTPSEQLEVLQIHSNNGPISELFITRPFRQIHPSCTLIALIGGGTKLKPGEVSLAHRGVLFLDELLEFSRTHLESLRQPLEEKVVHLSRSSGTIKYPAQCTLVASMNPCPCGFLNDPQKACICQPYRVIQYQKKLSGPLLDRLDLVVEVQRQSVQTYQQQKIATHTAIKRRVAQARKIQRFRFKNTRIRTNSEMSTRQIKKLCQLTHQSRNLLIEAGNQFLLSGRQYYQIIKTARTIADLENSEVIETKHIAEALQYRYRPIAFAQ